MDHSLISFAYRVMPFLPGAYGVGAYLATWPSTRRGLWIAGLAIAAALVGFTTVASHDDGFPLGRALAAWTVMFALPTLVATAAVDGLRRTRVPRWMGFLAIIGLCAAAQFVGRSVSLAVLDLVEATG